MRSLSRFVADSGEFESALCPCCAGARIFRSGLAQPSRRDVMQAMIAAAVAVATPAIAQTSPAADAPIKIFVARKIITMDRSWPTASAVAVEGGRIVAVGALDSVKLSLGGKPYRVDRTFEDAVLTPGFIDAHGHPVVGGTAMTRPLLTYLPTPNPYGPAFPGVKTRAQALAKLKEYVARAKAPDETVIAWGYDTIALGGDLLDKTDLDAISATQPLLVWDASEHFVFANSAAMRKYAITREALSVNGVRAGADGEPNGQFMGTTAAQVIMHLAVAEILTPQATLQNMRFIADLARKNGVTTMSELAFGVVNFDLERFVFDKFFNDPATPARCIAVTDVASTVAAHGDQAIDFVRSLRGKSTEKLTFNGVKFFSDDAFLSLGMAIENPGYSDGRKGIFITPPDKLKDVMAPWWNAGFQIHVHTNGNGGNQATIDALAALQDERPRTEHRFTLQHYGISTPEQTRRAQRLGAIASVNPYYLYYRSEFNAPYIGAERAYTAARLKTLVDAGVPTALHCDTPVAPPVPLEMAWIAVNRFGLSGKVRGPEERVSVDQALRMITADAAFTLGAEDRIGSIAPGKHADFTVLEQDPYATRPDRLRDIKVWGTVFAGEPHPASAIKA
jgi:predicted amidohydrolase YtcJ